MSETETNIGKLIPVQLLEGETNEDYAKRILKGVKNEYNNNFLECLLQDGYREYILYNDVLYRTENKRYGEGGDVFQAFRQDDGSIDYVLTYYNGGCSFNEAMEYALVKS